MRDMENTRVTVVYRDFLEPVEDDPAPHVPGETYSVRNVEAALLFHPRAEIVAYEGADGEATTTEKAKRQLAAFRHDAETAKAPEPEKEPDKEPAKEPAKDSDKK